MRIDVTAQDLNVAEKRLSNGCFRDMEYRDHNWHNPIAIAIERIFGPSSRACVSNQWVSLSLPGDRCQRVPAHGEVETWRREWVRGVAQPHVFNIALTN